MRNEVSSSDYGLQHRISELKVLKKGGRATPTVLTSWKDIANYLGKSVRTVQRWEQEMGLPVHRRHMRRNGVVLARCGDIDAWMRTHFDGECQPELEALRKENAALREENKLLRDLTAQPSAI